MADQDTAGSSRAAERSIATSSGGRGVPATANKDDGKQTLLAPFAPDKHKRKVKASDKKQKKKGKHKKKVKRR